MHLSWPRRVALIVSALTGVLGTAFVAAPASATAPAPTPDPRSPIPPRPDPTPTPAPAPAPAIGSWSRLGSSTAGDVKTGLRRWPAARRGRTRPDLGNRRPPGGPLLTEDSTW